MPTVSIRLPAKIFDLLIDEVAPDSWFVGLERHAALRGDEHRQPLLTDDAHPGEAE